MVTNPQSVDRSTALPASNDAAVPRGWVGGLVFAALIVLAAFNLRPAVVAVGPLVDAISAGTGLAPAGVSLLTTLPLVCFGVFAAVAAGMGVRIGVDRAIVIALALIVAGIGLRLFEPLTALFLGTVVAASGIALGNVLIPAAIKQYRPQRLGVLMAAYSVSLQAGATLAAGVTVPVQTAVGLDWRGALAIWIVPAAVALLFWLPRARIRAASVELAADADAATGTVWRTCLGWAAGAFIGLQSGIYFAVATWLPRLLQDTGASAVTAGYVASLVGLLGVIGGLPIPILAVRMRRQSLLVLLTVALFLAGLLGLLVAPGVASWVWATLLGLGQGAGLALALTLFTLRARTAVGAARLSGMAQTVGYLIAASGPIGVGAAYEMAGSWGLPLALLFAALVPLLVSGLYLSRPTYLEDHQ